MLAGVQVASREAVIVQVRAASSAVASESSTARGRARGPAQRRCMQVAEIVRVRAVSSGRGERELVPTLVGLCNLDACK